MKQILIVFLFVCFTIFACKSEPKSTRTIASNKVEKPTLKNSAQVFFSKNELSLPSQDHIHFAKGNEIVLFRPSEFDFGQRLEHTQDQSLLVLDGNFEELTNEVIAKFKVNKNVKVSICEKPVIAIPQANDTLYFSTLKNLYGAILCKPDKKPEFIPATDKNIIEQIEISYNQNE